MPQSESIPMRIDREINITVIPLIKGWVAVTRTSNFALCRALLVVSTLCDGVVEIHRRHPLWIVLAIDLGWSGFVYLYSHRQESAVLGQPQTSAFQELMSWLFVGLRLLLVATVSMEIVLVLLYRFANYPRWVGEAWLVGRNLAMVLALYAMVINHQPAPRTTRSWRFAGPF